MSNSAGKEFPPWDELCNQFLNNKNDASYLELLPVIIQHPKVHPHLIDHQMSQVLNQMTEVLKSCSTDLDQTYQKETKAAITIIENILQMPEPARVPPLREVLMKLELLHDLLPVNTNSSGPEKPEKQKSKEKDAVNKEARGSQPRRLGDFLVELGYVTDEELQKALQAQKSEQYPGLRVGDILQKWEIITRAQLDEAIELQMLDSME